MRIVSFAAALLAATSIAPAYATMITADSGWQDDQTDGPDIPSMNSSWDFTLTGNGIFSVADCCAPGDVFTLSGGATGVSTYYAGLFTDVQAGGSYSSYWTDASFSKIAVALAAGTYSITITGDCGAGCPAGFGVRLDSVSGSVPEPASWALMLGGFGMVGGAMRSRRKAAVTFA
jgi:hypothetical protein